MQRGDVFWVDFDPVRGSESNRRRPAVIVSNDAVNQTAEQLGCGILTVVPLTTNVARVYPFQVLLSAGDAGLKQASKAQAEQVRSIACERLGSRAGRLDLQRMGELDEALRLHLAL